MKEKTMNTNPVKIRRKFDKTSGWSSPILVCFVDVKPSCRAQ
jgi:hypothetical protein